jgi:hypothetical protein
MAVATSKKYSLNSSSNSYSLRHSSKKEQVRSVHVLLRPGKHFLKESLVIRASPHAQVTFSTLKLPKNRFYSPRFAYADNQGQSYPEQKSRLRSNSFRQLMGCRSSSGVSTAEADPTTTAGGGGGDTERISLYDSDSSDNSLVFMNDSTHSRSSTPPPPKYPERATLILKTRRQNEPIIRIKQGNLKLSDIDLLHSSYGIDIWNGNAAVQIQPPCGPDHEPLPAIPRPWAWLEHVSITSKSGRGVVCLDGGNITLRTSLIYECAATGIYIGGVGSQADVETTDVIRNGIGSRLPMTRAPRVATGHSGVYLEQGVARIVDCNISRNYLSGISAVSHDNSILSLEQSDLVANGNCNLEMPPPGSKAHEQSTVANNNNMASVGRPCLRSNLEIPGRLPASF